MGGVGGTYHLIDFTSNTRGHPLCGEFQGGYIWPREDFDRFVEKGEACVACIAILKNKALEEKIERIKRAYQPEFIVSDQEFANLNHILMRDEYQVYTAVGMARKQMEQVNVQGAMEYLCVDQDKSYCRNERLVKELVARYRDYKAELRDFNELFGE